MQSKIRIVFLLLILLVVASALLFWWGAPRLLAVSPMDRATDVLAGSELHLAFSHSMQEDSVMERLVIEPPRLGTFTWQGHVLVFSPDEPWPEGETIQVRLKAGSRASGLGSLPMTQEVTWSFTIGQPRLVYLYPAKQPADIHILDLRTSESWPITNAPGGVEDFEVSLRGDAIYYSTRDTHAGSSINRLELGEQEQGSVSQEDLPPATFTSSIQILACPQALCRALAISPGGDFLAYERTAFPGSGQPNYPQVWLVPLPQTNTSSFSIPQDALMMAGDPTHQTLMPSWSSNGMLVFYDVDAKAFIFLDPRNGERARFSNQTGQSGAWHPNGRDFIAPEIFFLDASASASLTDLKSLADSHLILFNWQSVTAQDLTPGEGIEDAAPAFSPDGSFLAFARKYLDVKRWTPGRQIWLLQMEGGEARSLTNDPLFNHFDFAWSPSGERLAYVRFDQSTMTQPPEIWVIDLSTGRATQLVKEGYAPGWIP